jgi:hypothetical protein
MANINIRKTAVCAAILLGAQALVAQPASAAAEVPFNGSWASVDTDGSNQTLTVRGAGAYTRAVYLYDDAATVCGGAPARVPGSGVIDGDVLFLRAVVVCTPGGNQFREHVVVGFIYDAGSDTLVDSSGVTWYRSS